MAFVSIAGVPRHGFLADLVGGRVMAQDVLSLVSQPARNAGKRLSVGTLISRVSANLGTVENATHWVGQAVKAAPAAAADDAIRAHRELGTTYRTMYNALHKDADAAGSFASLEGHIDDFRAGLSRAIDSAMAAERAAGLHV
jgi:hypothetical protein